MATQGIEEITENAIRAAARDCGSLSMECSDVAGYVEGVASKLDAHLKMLDTLEEVTTRLLADQARVSDSTDEARRSEEHTSELQSLMRISYAVFCLKKKTTNTHSTPNSQNQSMNSRH